DLERVAAESAFPATVDNALSIRGPGRRSFLLLVLGQARQPRPVHVDGIDLGGGGISGIGVDPTLPREHELFPNRRPVGVIVICPSSTSVWGSSSRGCVICRGASPSTGSPTLATKITLSVVGAPGSVLTGTPTPDAEAWNAMRLPSGDQVAELPRVSSR